MDVSDEDFWYNLNANFDLIDACFKLYQWTGNKTYINDEAFDRFFQLTLNQYVERWQLQPDKIMDRPALMNLKPSTTKYRYSRGIPSYDELQSDLTVSGDLLGMIYNGFRTYAIILRLRHHVELTDKYAKQAQQYRKLIDSRWWDEKSQAYFGFYTSDKKFNAGGIANSEFSSGTTSLKSRNGSLKASATSVIPRWKCCRICRCFSTAME